MLVTEPAKVAAPARCAVYYHYDQDDVLLYIGLARWIPNRNISHSIFAPWVRYAVRMEGFWYDSREIAAEVEAEGIRTLDPIFNARHAPDGRYGRIAAYLADRGEPVPAQSDENSDLPPMERLLLIQRGRQHWKTGSGKAVRVAAGHTLAQMAATVGVSVPVLSRWENGKSRPRTDAAIRWAKVLAELERSARAAA